MAFQIVDTAPTCLIDGLSWRLTNRATCWYRGRPRGVESASTLPVRRTRQRSSSLLVRQAAPKNSGRIEDKKEERILEKVSAENGEPLAEGDEPAVDEAEAEPSLVAAISLVAGTMIGAGVLALPSVTWRAGFVPSTAALIGGWMYMTCAALLVAEASLYTMRKYERPSVSMLSMTDLFLGSIGGKISSAFYLFIMLALLIAYIAQAGGILAEGVHAPYWQGASAFTLGVGGFLYVANQDLVESTNNILVGVLVATFIALVSLVSPGVHPDYLAGTNWAAVIPALPTILVALVYHQIVPVICAQLKGDVVKVRYAIVLGTLLPLSMFIVWNAVILGTVSPDFLSQFLVSGETLDPLALLRKSGDQVGIAVSVFSEIAIVTSFIGFVFGIAEFLEDISNNVANETIRSALSSRPVQFSVLLPAMGFAITSPNLFFSAIDLTGTFGMTVLFGIIPATMVGKLRRQRKREEAEEASLSLVGNPGTMPELVPGGEFTLAFMIAVAVSIMANDIWHRIF
ncbi:Tyrosine-specific transport protein [Porphyridium purpureum]|uniref:Tyrosine-specific transport protein n=1 Tax=Porphyridium purpureum TaxID=35688 RepID=A0A5J4Z2Q3_PORPP|nr:Tyrosine-specific transport protein [Porphyridium purpureum]|eukprot:POR0502..scf208_2